MAQPFDVRRLALTGEAVPIAERIALGGASRQAGAFAVSQTGEVAYQNAKLVRQLRKLTGAQLSSVEGVVCLWLGLPATVSGA